MERRNFLRLAGAAIVLPMLPAFAVAEKRPDDIGYYTYEFSINALESEWKLVSSRVYSDWRVRREAVVFESRTRPDRELRVSFTECTEAEMDRSRQYDSDLIGHPKFILTSRELVQKRFVKSDLWTGMCATEPAEVSEMLANFESKVNLPMDVRDLFREMPSYELLRNA
jgi:hypothetical protein